MKFKLFDLNRDGLGVEKNEDTTPNVGYFFKSLWRKFPKLISINLFVMNLLPLPALDGGRFLCMLIELIIRRPIPAKVEGFIHAIGLLALLALTAVIAFKDLFFPV